MASPTSAQASLWQWSNGFEGSAAVHGWRAERYGSSNAGVDAAVGAARTGGQSGWIWAQTQFASLGQQVRLSPAQLHSVRCGAAMYIKAPAGAAKVNLEVINPSNWTYIALKSVTLSSSSYTAVVTPTWIPGPIDVYLRVSLVGQGGFSMIRVDDAYIQCFY
ncbi:MAG: hypothetical protein ACRC0L_09625 [Angustibacter sp.]